MARTTKKYPGAPADLDERIEKARAFGREAFANGKKAIPALDMRLHPLLEGIPVGGGGIAIIDAWSNGWHLANLKQVHAVGVPAR